MALSIVERLEKNFVPEPNTGCWLWSAALNAAGYGILNARRQGFSTLAHRISYAVFVGPIPGDLPLDHKCRQRCCVNPAHLEPVTLRENIRRGVVGVHNRSKTVCPQGHPYSGDNVFMNGGSRICRICHRDQTKKSMRRNYAKKQGTLL